MPIFFFSPVFLLGIPSVSIIFEEQKSANHNDNPPIESSHKSPIVISDVEPGRSQIDEQQTVPEDKTLSSEKQTVSQTWEVSSTDLLTAVDSDGKSS